MIAWWLLIVAAFVGLVVGVIIEGACAMSGRVSDQEDYRAAYKVERHE